MSTDFEDAVATGATIDDYLISLADGLAQAQRQLDEAARAADGVQPTVSYQIPRLDFELRMTFEIQQSSAGTAGAAPAASAGKARSAPMRLRAAPVRSESQASVASVIKGSVVAVPVTGGRPPPRLELTAVPAGAAAFQVTARLSNALGEALPGEEVQFNIDRDASRQANVENGLGERVPDAGSYLERSVAVTGDDGTATTRLVVAAAEPRGAALVIAADAVQRTRTLIVRTGGQ